MWSVEEQKATLEKFFYECVRYWERELKTDSDLDKTPYINAIKEIPTTNPYLYKDSPKIDEEVRNDFVKARYIDCYGKDWREYYERL